MRESLQAYADITYVYRKHNTVANISHIWANTNFFFLYLHGDLFISQQIMNLFHRDQKL